MTDFTDPQTAGLRLSHAERDEAVAQLNANLREGRISEAEFAERSATAQSAVTRGDVAPLFSDLPPVSQPSAPAPVQQGASYGAAYAAPPHASAVPPGAVFDSPPMPSVPDPAKGPIGGAAGLVAVSITPFVALILFFVTGNAFGYNYSWLWFLLVPVVSIVVYGGGSRRHSNRN